MRTIVRAAIVLALVVAASACSGGSWNSGSTTTLGSFPGSSLPAGATTTTPFQTSGVRTVLSPLGINVRAQPSTSAHILGSAAEGVTLNVTGHTDEGGGWYQVMGSTVNSGYIKDDPALSAPGEFESFTADDSSFSGLAPSGWNKTSPSMSVVVLQKGTDSITIVSAASTKQLPQNQVGYRNTKSTTTVVCGVTGQLTTYARSNASGAPSATTAPLPTTPGATVTTVAGAPIPTPAVVPEQYLLQIHLTLDPMHVLGVSGFVADLSDAPAVQEVVSSLSFPFPQCQGGTAAATTTTTL